MCILIDSKNKTLINSKTGLSVQPNCFDDLVAVHSYLLSGKHPEEAHKMLKAVFRGEKPITDMVKKARGD